MPSQPTPAPRLPCPNPACPRPHVVRNGSIQGRQRYHGRGCGAWVGATHGTPLDRLRTPPEEIGRALLVVMRRGSLCAAEEVTGHQYETIGRWRRLAADHAEALSAALVRNLGRSTLEVDAFWSCVTSRTGRSPQTTQPPSASAGAV
jgi:transposase-like protein